MKKQKPVESRNDFKNRIASIALGIPIEQVILNRGARLEKAREKWVTKHFGMSHVKRKK